MDVNVKVTIDASDRLIEILKGLLAIKPEIQPPPDTQHSNLETITPQQLTQQIMSPQIAEDKSGVKTRKYRTQGELRSTFEIAVGHIEKFIARKVSFTARDVLPAKDVFAGPVRDMFDAWMISNSHRVVKEKVIGANGFGAKVIYSPYWKENGVTFYAEHPKPQRTHVVKGTAWNKKYNTKEEVEKTLSDEFQLDMHQNIPGKQRTRTLKDMQRDKVYN